MFVVWCGLCVGYCIVERSDVLFVCYVIGVGFCVVILF